MRAVKRALIALLAAVALSAGVASAAKLTGPSAARVGDTLSVTATGLKPGRYTLTLASDSRPTLRSSCVARLAGPTRTSAGRVALSGVVPKRLTCWENDSVKLGKVKVTPGAYHLIVAVPTGPSGYDVKYSFVRRALKIKR
jgi:hypothetical protein